MKKVFLYLYPIKEYTKMFLYLDDKTCDEWGIERPLPMLNKTIDKRYREKGYQIVFALYPDKELYGIEKKELDRVIYTDISFSESSAYDDKGYKKKNFIPKYPNESKLIEQLGDLDELVVGGYHAMDCVKRVAENALNMGINTLVDLDLTDLFFNVYRNKDYFDIENYSPERFKTYMINRTGPEDIEFRQQLFDRKYASSVYGFTKQTNKRL